MTSSRPVEEASEADRHREEQPWDDASEVLLEEWCAKSVGVASKHDREAKRAKALHALWGLPTVVIPVVIGPLNSLFSTDPLLKNVELVALCLSGVCGAVTTFYNFGALAERHFTFSAKYSDLITDIRHQLAKPRKYRSACDVVTLRINMLFDSINNNAPPI